MKYLGVDYGLKRVGLSLSEGELASPYKIIEVKNQRDAVSKIFSLYTNNKFDKVVVGMPQGEMGKATLRFTARLKELGVDVVTADETLSSKQALQEMIAFGVRKKKRALSDDRAAAIILQGYLDTLV